MIAPGRCVTSVSETPKPAISAFSPISAIIARLMTEVEKFDLVVLGSGPGGEKGAAQAAYFDKRVALVERSADVGGACVHTGTLPSKTLRETALYLTGFRRRELYGMSVRLDRKKSLRQLVGRLRSVTDRQTNQVSRNLKRHGIELVEGSARFEDPHTVC